MADGSQRLARHGPGDPGSPPRSAAPRVAADSRFLTPRARPGAPTCRTWRGRWTTRRTAASAMVQAVRDVVEDVLGTVADEASYVSCNHNHVRRETHFGSRCGSTARARSPPAAGEPGLIPGSMGTHSFHVEGRGCEEALASSAHGAGRRLSRTEARRSAVGQGRHARVAWRLVRPSPRAAAPGGSAVRLQGHRRRAPRTARAGPDRQTAAAGVELQRGLGAHASNLHTTLP